jgi:hypothetical protein
MKTIPHEQGSPEWLHARLGIPTASELANVLTPELAIRKGEMPITYAAQKAAERWLGHELTRGGSWSMEQGQIVEPEARAWLALHLAQDIRTVGLCLTDDGKCGASPDGMLDDKSGLEIKCPQPTAHVKYLAGGVVPKEYIIQVLAGMWVADAPCWRFVSWCRGFPPLVVVVPRVDEEMALIEAGFAHANGLIDKMHGMIERANGGRVRTPEPEATDLQEIF